MNYKLNEYNPIEEIRITERMSQEGFAKKLGYDNTAQYSYHVKQFTQDIIGKVNIIYDRDLKTEVINHLKFENRKLKKQIKFLTKRVSKSDPIAARSGQSINAIMENLR